MSEVTVKANTKKKVKFQKKLKTTKRVKCSSDVVDQQKLKQASKKQYQKVKGGRSNLQFVIKEFQES